MAKNVQELSLRRTQISLAETSLSARLPVSVVEWIQSRQRAVCRKSWRTKLRRMPRHQLLGWEIRKKIEELADKPSPDRFMPIITDCMSADAVFPD